MSKKKIHTQVKEFDFISRYLVPLTNGYKGALQLKDDIAIIPKDAKHDYVVTLDTIAEDTHFLSSAGPKDIATKLMGSNLSDLASCGADPKFYFLTGNLSKDMDEKWLKSFTEELGRIQKQYNIILMGGDTVRTKGKKFFSATLIGEVKKGKALLRSGAKAGDDVYVSGVIGEAWVGLQLLQGNIDLPKVKHKKYIASHYSPKPQIELGKKLVGVASSCTDISDGLLKDLSNILNTSGVAAEIFAAKIPLALNDKKYLGEQLSAGDDYQLVFTAPASKAVYIRNLKFPITKIGKIVKDDKQEKLTIISVSNEKIKFGRWGYEH